ncbi:hypothetical protein SprV_0100060400 [Sparganum proliferum]
MGLLGHIRIHEIGTDRCPDTPTASNTPTMSSPTLTPSPCVPITTTASSVADTDTADYSCLHSPRTFSSRVGLVGHLRIHCTEPGEPVPGAPTYTHRTRLHYPHCSQTFTHRMGLFGHVRIHDHLRLRNVEQMRMCGLFLNDLGLHDFSRDMVFVGEQESTQLKLSLDSELYLIGTSVVEGDDDDDDEDDDDDDDGGGGGGGGGGSGGGGGGGGGGGDDGDDGDDDGGGDNGDDDGDGG